MKVDLSNVIVDRRNLPAIRRVCMEFLSHPGRKRSSLKRVRGLQLMINEAYLSLMRSVCCFESMR
jgi:hypothetical protein